MTDHSNADVVSRQASEAPALNLLPSRLFDARTHDAPGASSTVGLACSPATAQRFRAALSGDAGAAGLTLGLCTLGTALMRYAVCADLSLGAFVADSAGLRGLPVRLDIVGTASLRELFAQTRRQLVRGMRAVTDPQDSLAAMDAALTVDTTGGVVGMSMGARYAFGLELHGDALRLTLSSPCLSDAEPYQQAFLEFWRATIEAVLDAPGAALREVEIACGDADADAVPGSDFPAPRHRHLAAAFREQAALSPDAPAVVDQTKRLSYAEVDRLSDGLAVYLRANGLGPEGRVVIGGEKQVWSIVAMLGVLKAGGAYVSLNARIPAQRLQEILAHSDARAVIAPSSLVETVGYDALSDDAARGSRLVILFEDIDYLARKHAGTDLGREPAGGEALAYVAYTSGSTGQPKGVACTHAGVLNLCDWFNRRYPSALHPNVLQLTELGFDPSVEQVFATLLHGGCLYLANVEDLQADAHGFLVERDINLLNATPQLLWSLLAEAPRVHSLRTVITGGDRLPPALQDTLLRKGYALHNHYGPTETTVDACAWAAVEGAPATVGKPLDGVQARVLLDDASIECPPGVAGEIYIGGAGVARGYLGQPGLTAQAFVPDSSRPGRRRFRSGDRGLRNLEGEIELLGRLNREIKVGGARIDPAEIEQALSRLPGVCGAALVARTGRAGQAVLDAFVESDAPLDLAAVRQQLRATLPEYMLPSRIVSIARLPTDANGKIDRAALATYGSERSAVNEPRTEFERDLLGIWREVLGHQSIGMDEDFLDLGGNSLQAARMIVKIYESFGTNVSLSEFFASGSIAGCANMIERRLLDGAAPEVLTALGAAVGMADGLPTASGRALNEVPGA
jgi:amino acid adenylation domain-containing protein